MKKIIFLITVTSAISAAGFSQVDFSSSKINQEHTANSYLLKAKNQKTAAWVCLGSGVALAATGVIIGSVNATSDFISYATTLQNTPDHKNTAEGILLMIGGAGIVASIPLFISSAKNKTRANLTMTSQKTAFGIPGNVSKNITGISLSIPIGK